MSYDDDLKDIVIDNVIKQSDRFNKHNEEEKIEILGFEEETDLKEIA